MTPAKRPARRASWVLLGVAAALLLYYLLTPQGIFGSKAQGDGYFGFHYLPNLTAAMDAVREDTTSICEGTLC